MPAPAAAVEIELEYTSTFDGSRQLAAAFAPPQIRAEEPLPLLAIAHPMGCDRTVAKRLGYDLECARRRWLVVCPELHGRHTSGATSCAALEAQHDLLDAIAEMRRRYPVDPHRIYLAGRSMGGNLAMMTLAKHPDLFAAGVAGQAISDYPALESWDPAVPEAVRRELGDPGTDAFEYRRRSPIHFAPNFRHVPLILWHGTNDEVVPPDQAVRMLAAIRRYFPQQPEVFWKLAASHHEPVLPASWVCDRLELYRNVGDDFTGMDFRFFRTLRLRTDEAGDFFYLRVDPRPGEIAEFSAEITPDGILRLAAAGLRTLTVNLEKISLRFPVRRIVCRADDAPETVWIVRRDGGELIRGAGRREFELPAGHGKICEK